MPESDPIRVFEQDGQWLVDYGSYAHGTYATRDQAINAAKIAAASEKRELEILPGDSEPAAVADHRDAAADQREAAADLRDEAADERDTLADLRDARSSAEPDRGTEK